MNPIHRTTDESHVESQLALFDDLLDTSVREGSKLPVQRLKQCRECEHILGVHFQHTLFFCPRENKYGGQFGKKIEKSHPSCWHFQQATTDLIQVIDGRYGGQYKTTKR